MRKHCEEEIYLTVSLVFDVIDFARLTGLVLSVQLELRLESFGEGDLLKLQFRNFLKKNAPNFCFAIVLENLLQGLQTFLVLCIFLTHLMKVLLGLRLVRAAVKALKRLRSKVFPIFGEHTFPYVHIYFNTFDQRVIFLSFLT